MKKRLLLLMAALSCATVALHSQSTNSCRDLSNLNLDSAEITKAELIPAGAMVPVPYAGTIGPLPVHCRVDGIIHRRKGVGGEEFGIGFAVALPAQDAWNGDFMMQGGGGGNGVVSYPLGPSYTGDKSALGRGFAVASTDTGHKAKTGPFDFSFMRDQQAYLDFAYMANAEVAQISKQIIARYYAKPAAYSYFVGCSTGGREGMILSQRYPTVFNGIVSGDPAMRTGLSNLAIGQWIPVAYNQASPKDSFGQAADREVSYRERSKVVHGCSDEAVRCAGRSCGRNDLRSAGLRFRSRGAGLQGRTDGRMHSAGEDRGHQEGICRTEERLWHAGVPRLPVRRRHCDERAGARTTSSAGRAASSAHTPPPLKSMWTKKPCTPPIRSSNRPRQICRRSLQMAASSSSSTATVIRGSRPSIRSATTSHWPRRTAARRRWPHGAGYFLCRGWRTAAADRLWTVSTCLPRW